MANASRLADPQFVAQLEVALGVVRNGGRYAEASVASGLHVGTIGRWSRRQIGVRRQGCLSRPRADGLLAKLLTPPPAPPPRNGMERARMPARRGATSDWLSRCISCEESVRYHAGSYFELAAFDDAMSVLIYTLHRHQPGG